MSRRAVMGLVTGLALVALALVTRPGRTAAPGATTQPTAAQPAALDTAPLARRKKPKPYTTPSGLFIQERASKGLPGPGQHFSFGALKPWDELLSMLDEHEDRKLLLVVRHGQAVSNYLSDTLGPDEWFAVEGTCDYTDKDGTHWDIFDADLTDNGKAQAQSLNSMLAGGGWFNKVTGSRHVRAIVSPLTRCLTTAANVLRGLPLNATNVEELVRETLGEDTCDARRSASDPPKGVARAPDAPCAFEHGLRSKFPQFKFNVHDARDEEGRGFGLLGDEDHLWTKDKREKQRHQVKRARRFLDILYEHAPEKVVVIVTHSGFTRSLLLAVQREPYRPANAEMVPVIVDKNQDYYASGDDSDDDVDASFDDEGAGAAGAPDAAAAPAPVAAAAGGGAAQQEPEGRPGRGAAAAAAAVAS